MKNSIKTVIHRSIKIAFFVTVGLFSTTAYGQLSLDRTRIVFDRAKTNSQSITLTNTNPEVPYLAQSWIENEYGHKIEDPLIALPILQRLEPKQEKQVKISLSGANNLPTDRESLLYFNALGIPPKGSSSGGNEVNIVVQSKIKLFYRPKGLPEFPNNGWIKKLEVNKQGNQYTLTNPTPYHLVILGFSSGQKGRFIEKEMMVKPFATETVKLSLGNTPTIHFINDFGSTESNHYECQSATCKLIP
ncbi:molecular chaperone [Ignatzschineria ureiclastica]|uniref:Molecular chaperone n=1 Tax=Ignatzschineria ureiclastica TaxID=472582 RepID=A0A2U2AEN9_9GAMM|nr:molecular chaperone [Ignatzschineria ureiclastica]PWD81114.1 molecular chaperone [Ignatzschineria ureiclastica]GGZ96336.1 fimbrial chaperone protein StdC [Ignatzschineria ureiclastica]